jgi:hypothetical protein
MVRQPPLQYAGPDEVSVVVELGELLRTGAFPADLFRANNAAGDATENTLYSIDMSMYATAADLYRAVYLLLGTRVAMAQLLLYTSTAVESVETRLLNMSHLPLTDVIAVCKHHGSMHRRRHALLTLRLATLYDTFSRRTLADIDSVTIDVRVEAGGGGGGGGGDDGDDVGLELVGPADGAGVRLLAGASAARSSYALALDKTHFRVNIEQPIENEYLAAGFPDTVDVYVPSAGNGADLYTAMEYWLHRHFLREELFLYYNAAHISVGGLVEAGAQTSIDDVRARCHRSRTAASQHGFELTLHIMASAAGSAVLSFLHV